MQGNFIYHNPTKLYFGDHSLEYLKDEMKNYGNNVVLIYGGGSIKKSGLYDEIIKILGFCGKNVSEISGVMPNPTLEKLYDGIEIARAAKADFLLAVGGGSVIDYAKAVAVSVHLENEDPWERYFEKFADVGCEVVPVGAVLTMAGTGSEMNGGTVITNEKTKQKRGHVFGPNVMPKFAVLNPIYTMTLPHYQMVAGIYDIFNHISEQYFSNTDDNTSDYIAEGLMRSVISASRIANKNPQDYEARSNIMWTATWALNTLISRGKDTDWTVHMLGQAVGGYTNATHGMTLSAVSMPYYRYIMQFGLPKFKRFAEVVWGVNPNGKSDDEIANEGLDLMEDWMKELGLVMKISDFGVKEEDIDAVADLVIYGRGGYRSLSREEAIQIFKESL